MLSEVPELAHAENVIERLEDPSWGFEVSSLHSANSSCIVCVCVSE